MFEALPNLWDKVFGNEHDAGRNMLTVRLLFRAGASAVRLELAAAADCPDRSCVLEPLFWEVPYSEFESNADARFDLAIPDTLVDDLRFRLAQDTQLPAEPLWLKLVRPYGLLGTAPWEATIAEGLGRPVLRLPESPHRAGERADLFENAVIVDPSAEARPDDVVRRVDGTVKAILEGSNRAATRVHIFPRGAWYDRLQSLASDRRVCVYDPAEASTSFEMSRSEWGPGTALRAAAWAKWISGAVGTRGLDALHLICRSHETGDGAVLMLSCSPSPREDEMEMPAVSGKVPSAAIEEEELKLLLDRSGAWAVSFLPSEPELSRQMAYVADAFAHRRGGAVLFAALTGPEHAATLTAAYRLLFGASRLAPAMIDGFLYCHPSLVGDDFSAARPDLLGIIADHAKLLGQRAPVTQRLLRSVTRFIPGVATFQPTAPPNWLASTQRFLESAALDEARRSSPDVLFSAPARSSGGVSEVSEARVGRTTDAYGEHSISEEIIMAKGEFADSRLGRTPEMQILADIQAVVANFVAKEGSEDA